MGATTRARTGNSKPRIISNLESALPPTTSTKANTSKPRATKNNGSKVAGGRVTKAKSGTTATPTTSATATAKKDKPSANVKTVKKPRTKTEKAVDSVVGTAEKVVGDLQGKPGKKAAGTSKMRGTDSTTTTTTTTTTKRARASVKT
ncbi:hypothetical protein ACJQWK_00232 [Exserohilum turcicum]|uniref:Uncharacterized protein n=1 Tax=Exserohilum turcicum (strain 28A) TaxID=671987 RepID=R0K5D0_EXST2|nr:uncharacterized protein SETTUDRAFT_156068 [Exserohilum turcica Et28A]EOA83552.1 hypothetical protein SETTUDRAFT_156068 [Exserohilum turcica Et28A]